MSPRLAKQEAVVSVQRTRNYMETNYNLRSKGYDLTAIATPTTSPRPRAEMASIVFRQHCPNQLKSSIFKSTRLKHGMNQHVFVLIGSMSSILGQDTYN